MAKTKKKETLGNKFYDRMWKEHDAQYMRVKDVISQFYPDGVLAEFVEYSQVGKALIESPRVKPFSEDEQARSECLEIIEDAYKKDSLSMDMNLDSECIRFQGRVAVDYTVAIMLKTAPEDAPIFLKVKDRFFDKDVILRFLINEKKKKAILAFEDFDATEGDVLKASVNSFIELSEFHALIFSSPRYLSKEVCFIVSFSQLDDRCNVEEAYIYDRGFIVNFLAFDGNGGTAPIMDEDEY